MTKNTASGNVTIRSKNEIFIITTDKEISPKLFDKICQKSLTAHSLIDHGHSRWHRDGDEPSSAEVVENRNSIGFLSARDLKTVPSFGERGGRTGCWGASVIATTLRSKCDIFGIV